MIRWLVVNDFVAKDVVAAASSALGAALTLPPGGPDMGDSGHSMVLRCHRADGTVIVKAYSATEGGRVAFAREAAGLAYSAPTGVGPELLAADPAFPLVVLEDLGSAPSLATLLLDPAASGVRDALLAWVGTFGRLAALCSGGAGGRAELALLYAGYGGSGEPGWPGIGRAVRSAADMLGWAGVPVPSGLAAEVGSLDMFLLDERHQVFSPGDLCPDNDMLTAAGVRLIDFEDACFHSLFLDAAFLRMPFSTCWCVLRLPADVAASLEEAYRASVRAVFPGLSDDEVWQHGIRRAMAVWTLHAMSYLLERSVREDRSMNDDVAGAPTARALLRYRWQVLRDELVSSGEMPALAQAMSGLLTATEHWQVPDLPVYPAFRYPAFRYPASA